LKLILYFSATIALHSGCQKLTFLGQNCFYYKYFVRNTLKYDFFMKNDYMHVLGKLELDVGMLNVEVKMGSMTHWRIRGIGQWVQMEG